MDYVLTAWSSNRDILSQCSVGNVQYRYVSLHFSGDTLIEVDSYGFVVNHLECEHCAD